MISDSLKQTLSQYVSHRTALGATKSINRKALRDDLRKEKSHVRNIFLMAAVMTGVLFTVMLALTVVHHNDMTWIAGLSTGLGVTVFGSIRFMSRLARELAETSLLLDLSSKLSDEDIYSVVSALLPGEKVNKSLAQAAALTS
jgi:hypothetical protein